MSGGGDKKKKTTSSSSRQTQGWEEAGSEFYQESYPVDAEIEVLWKDPKRLATLLPSKQTRAVASTVRLKTNDTRTYKSTVRRLTGCGNKSRRDSTITTTFNRRGSFGGGDVQVSMLPDLSEMRSNEQTAWEEVMGIKALPLSMARKKEEKAKIMSEQHLRLQGFEQLKWKKRKMWHKFKARLLEMYYKIELWRKHLKHIESHFGTGVVTFFCFIKWLFFLNLLIAILIILFLILPTLLLDDKKEECLNPSSNTTTCDYRYFCLNDSNNSNLILDIVQGTGKLERTILFHGFYSNEILRSDSNNYYNMPLAFLLVAIAYFLLSLMAILRTAAKGFKERLVEGEGQFYKYSNLVFGGWDFCIHNEKSAKFKHQAIYNEIKMLLQSERLEEERQNRTRQEKYKLFTFRLLINILVLAILFFCGGIVYNVFSFSENVPAALKDTVPQVIFEFLPSLSIVVLNMLVPLIFQFIISYEHYSPIFTIKMMLFRTIFLRLASLIVFYASIYSKIHHLDDNSSCPCWETFVGQQIYKLILTEFLMHLVMTFFVNFLRAFVARHVESKFIKLIGEQTFDLPRHVLDIIYTQTLCWFGIFFAPLISIMATVIFFILFYVKKFACLINCKPSTTIYRPSRSNSMFMSVLLISYMVAIIPIAFIVAELKPSTSCGPFRELPSIWNYMEQLFIDMPLWIQSIAAFITTAPFAIPMIIVLFLLLYYFMAVNSANKHMVNVLKNQLVLEGHDKKFLIDRLYMFIKQENEKRARLVNNSRSNDDTTIRS